MTPITNQRIIADSRSAAEAMDPDAVVATGEAWVLPWVCH
jgi:hypothetical protein